MPAFVLLVPSPITADQGAASHLKSYWLLAVDERPSEGADFARTALRDALKTI